MIRSSQGPQLSCQAQVGDIVVHFFQYPLKCTKKIGVYGRVSPNSTSNCIAWGLHSTERLQWDTFIAHNTSIRHDTLYAIWYGYGTETKRAQAQRIGVMVVHTHDGVGPFLFDLLHTWRCPKTGTNPKSLTSFSRLQAQPTGLHPLPRICLLSPRTMRICKIFLGHERAICVPFCSLSYIIYPLFSYLTRQIQQ